MATYAQIARAHLGNLGKVSLGFYPTPFHKLESISSAYDVNLWIKREDFSGSATKFVNWNICCTTPRNRDATPSLLMALPNPIT